MKIDRWLSILFYSNLNLQQNIQGQLLSRVDNSLRFFARRKGSRSVMPVTIPGIFVEWNCAFESPVLLNKYRLFYQRFFSMPKCSGYQIKVV